ncbi:MAG: CD1871A family CXXC motif-containing protein [Eubacteriales bacterium]|nr:CD1871A family CXXC motif-containing protein [Eubacteriales bacterium]
MKKRLQSSWIGIGIAALGIGMMAFGISRGEMGVVMTKAINICLECIGIG